MFTVVATWPARRRIPSERMINDHAPGETGRTFRDFRRRNAIS
jgi:hypothetical protein